MRKSPVKKSIGGYLTIALVSAGLFMPLTPITAKPLQGTASNASKPIKEATMQTKVTPGNSTKNVVLARNTAKAETAPSANTATPQKNQDKKAISRCWKRLMNMVREINHAHSNKSN